MAAPINLRYLEDSARVDEVSLVIACHFADFNLSAAWAGVDKFVVADIDAGVTYMWAAVRFEK